MAPLRIYIACAEMNLSSTSLYSSLSPHASGGPVVADEYLHTGAVRSEAFGPTTYRPKRYSRRDKDPAHEGLSSGPLAHGAMEDYSWANRDLYDGFPERIGVPPGLGPALNKYTKGLGMWDIMIDTIYDNPMEPDETRFYNLTSPHNM